MKKVLKIVTIALLIGVLLLLASGLVVLKTGWWKNAFLAYLNRYLQQNYQLSMEIKEVGGNLFSTLKLVEPHLVTNKQATVFTASELELTYHLKALFQDRRTVEQVRIEGLQFDYPTGVDTLRAHLALAHDTTRRAPLSITNLILTNVHITHQDSLLTSLIQRGYLRGSLTIADDILAAECDSVDLELPTFQEQVQLRNLKLSLQSDSLIVEQCELQNRSTLVKLAGILHFAPELRARLNFRLKNLLASERLKTPGTYLSPRDYLNIDGELQIAARNVQLQANFDGKLHNRRIQQGRLKGSLKNRRVQITQFSCRADSEWVGVNLKGDLTKQLTAVVELRKINTQAWDLTRQKTNLNGSISIASKGYFKNPQRVTADFNIRESSLEGFDFSYLLGSLQYEHGFITTTDTLNIKVGETQLRVEGLVNLNDSTLDLRAYFSNIKADLLAGYLKVDTLLGELDGFIEATGSLPAPDLRGWVKGHAFGVPNLVFQESIARFGLVNLREERFGDIFIEATNARTPLLKEEIPLTSMIVRFEGDTTIVRMLKIVSDELDIETRGRIIGKQEIDLQAFKIRQGANQLTALDPIRFNLARDTLNLRQVRFTLNQSLITASTVLVRRKLQDLQVELRDLPLALANDFLKDYPKLGGRLQGVVEYHAGARPILKGNLLIDEVRIADARFKQLALDGVLTEKRLQIGNLSIQDLHDGKLEARGSLGMHLLKEPQTPWRAADSLNLTMNFTNFDLSGYPGLPDRFADLRGHLSGSLLAYNTLGAPRFSYELNVRQPSLGNIKSNQVQLKGVYQDNRLTFTELLAVDNGGPLRGRGYLGCTISFVPLQVAIAPDAPVNMNFTMHSTDLQLLSNLLEDLESATGTFDLALSVTGTFAHPVRSGNISAKNATLILATTENPITGVDASAVIKNNLLEIISLSGYMKKPINPVRIERFGEKLKALTWDVLFPPKIAPDVPNLSVTGTIDFTNFFHPRYDLLLKGEELYIRTLLAEQEGTLDAEIWVKGRDTLVIEGEVDIIDFVLRNEFAGETRPALPVATSSKVYKTVNLHTMIPGSFYFQNSQLDCELEGEVWITQTGDDPYRLAGTLDVRRGKFFYLGWEFELLNGTIVFEPTAFNPILDIEAQVDLAAYGFRDTTLAQSSSASEYVTVKLSGYLDDPSLIFESANYSQSDILMYLTRTQNITSQGFNQEQVSADALNIFGRYFERQIEKNITRISGLDEFELRTRGSWLTAQSNDQWSILLGRKIAPNLYFKYERSFNLVEPYQQFGLEYRLNRNMSLVGEIDQDGLLNISYSLKFRY